MWRIRSRETSDGLMGTAPVKFANRLYLTVNLFRAKRICETRLSAFPLARNPFLPEQAL
jgi:hypothetical protein